MRILSLSKLMFTKLSHIRHIDRSHQMKASIHSKRHLINQETFKELLCFRSLTRWISTRREGCHQMARIFKVGYNLGPLRIRNVRAAKLDSTIKKSSNSKVLIHSLINSRYLWCLQRSPYQMKLWRQMEPFQKRVNLLIRTPLHRMICQRLLKAKTTLMTKPIKK